MAAIRAFVVVLVAFVLAGCEQIDGYVDRDDVCANTGEWVRLDDVARPEGGVLYAPGDLTPEQRQAVSDAARIRYEQSGHVAQWRVRFGGPERLRAGDDAVLMATCQFGDLPLADELEQSAWAMVKETGGLGVVWEGLAPLGWRYSIANQLAALEGRGEVVAH